MKKLEFTFGGDELAPDLLYWSNKTPPSKKNKSTRWGAVGLCCQGQEGEVKWEHVNNIYCT